MPMNREARMRKRQALIRALRKALEECAVAVDTVESDHELLGIRGSAGAMAAMVAVRNAKQAVAGACNAVEAA